VPGTYAIVEQVRGICVQEEVRTVSDSLLDLTEIAAKLRMPVATVRYKRHRGDLPFTFRLGRRVVAYESEVDAYIADRRAAGSGTPAA
jgi:predicted DNA-binding transcriptional regulator AlpA